MPFLRNDKNKQREPKKQSTLGFLFSPQIGRDLKPMGESLSMFVRLLAYVLASYRLFPKDHPALKDTTLRLTFRDVISISYSRLSFTKQGIPQILAFVAVFGSILLTALFFITLLLSALTGNAHAQLFDASKTAPQDWGIQWIDYLFLGTNMNLTNAAVQPPASTVFQHAVGAALSLYSTAILALAGFLLLYHLTSMIAETAHTGKPMGRANQIWAPIRLVFAIGMLVPITTGTGSSVVTGYNTAQYLAMQIARWGSGLASNIWAGFVQSMYDSSKIGCESSSDTTPSCIQATQEASSIVRHLVAVDGCAKIIKAYVDSSATPEVLSQYAGDFAGAEAIVAYAGSLDAYKVASLISISDPTSVGKHYVGMSISNETQFDSVDVKQICGGWEIRPGPDASSPYRSIYNAQNQTFFNSFAKVNNYTTIATNDILPISATQGYKKTTTKADILAQMIKDYQNDLNNAVKNNLVNADKAASTQLVNDIKNPHFTETGWLSAGAWFNKIVSLYSNRAMAVRNSSPVMISPSLANASNESKKQSGELIGILQSSAAAYKTYLASIDTQMETINADAKYTTPYSSATVDLSQDKEDTLKRILKGGLISGILELLDIVGQSKGMWNDDGSLRLYFGSTLNPLGELAAFGQNNLDSGIMLLNYGGIAYTASAALGSNSFASFFTGGLSGAASMLLSSVGGAMISLASIFIMTGFTLTFIVPLYPFIRFFFASVMWIMTVFETVVLAPLFALAHVNPYGDGLGGGYKYGYQVFLQVLLRPVLMIFGLIAGYLIFSVALHFLNDMFMIATRTSGSSSVRDIFIIGKLAYLIMYCVFVFVLANQAFSLVGLFPQVALQWFGLGSIREESIGDTKMAAVAAAWVAKDLLGGHVAKMAQAPGNAIKNMQASKDALLPGQRHAQLIDTLKNAGKESGTEKENGPVPSLPPKDGPSEKGGDGKDLPWSQVGQLPTIKGNEKGGGYFASGYGGGDQKETSSSTDNSQQMPAQNQDKAELWSSQQFDPNSVLSSADRSHTTNFEDTDGNDHNFASELDAHVEDAGRNPIHHDKVGKTKAVDKISDDDDDGVAPV